MAEMEVPESIRPHLLRTAEDPRPVVLMTCGIAGKASISSPVQVPVFLRAGATGSGKSTLAKAVVAAFPSFTRLSIDQIIHSRHGMYAVDYPAEKYDEYQAEADGIYDARFRELLLGAGGDIMLDRSFYSRADRDEVKAAVEAAGARWVLVYLKADRDVLWRRICERRAARGGADADAAFVIPPELLDAYVAGFEAPVGEGEIVIEVR